MKIRDVDVSFELYGGIHIGMTWKGHVGSASAYRDVEYFPVHGKEALMYELNNRPFLRIDNQIYNVKEIKSVLFLKETERNDP